jgi:hypothetical protein
MRLARARNLAVLISGVVLATSLAVGPAYAGPVSATRTVTSAGMASVAGGTVTSANGVALPGVVIDLFGWPSDATLKALKPGAPVPVTLLATTTTSNFGKYMLTVRAASLKAAAVESGDANLEIFSAVGGTWFLSYQTSSLPTRPSAPVTVNLSDKSKKPSCGLNSRRRPFLFKGWSLLRERPQAWAVVGQGYIVPQKATKGYSIQFNYNRSETKSQTSALGVGVSGYGFDAGYNVSGTSVSTAKQEQDFENQGENSWFRTQFSVGQYRGLCYSSDITTSHQKQHGKCPRTFTDQQGRTEYVHKCLWLVRSVGWFGSGDIQHPKSIPHTPRKFCGPEPKGQVIKTSNESAIQWTSGWNLGASLGIKGANLKGSFNSSSQTGYDDNAQMVFTFKGAGVMCGTNRDPSRSALLVMRGNMP